MKSALYEVQQNRKGGKHTHTHIYSNGNIVKSILYHVDNDMPRKLKLAALKSALKSKNLVLRRYCNKNPFPGYRVTSIKLTTKKFRLEIVHWRKRRGAA